VVLNLRSEGVLRRMRKYPPAHMRIFVFISHDDAHQPDLKGKPWSRKGACTALMRVCRIATSSGGDLRSMCPLCKLLPTLRLRSLRSLMLPLELNWGRSYLRSLPSGDERGLRCPPRTFHGDGGSGLPRHWGPPLVSRDSANWRSGRTVCPRHPVPPGSGPEIVSGMHLGSCRRDKRKSSLE